MKSVNSRSAIVGLACMTMLFLSVRPVSGSIIYLDIADIHLANDCLPSEESGTPSMSFDVNLDSIDDIQFLSYVLAGVGSGEPDLELVLASTLTSSRLIGFPLTQTSRLHAVLLPIGYMINGAPTNGFTWVTGDNVLIHQGIYDSDNPVPCDQDFSGLTGLIGLEFDISGNTHYGWLRVTQHPSSGAVILRDYAYESEPGVGIIAGAIPEPSTILLAGLGGLALLWRARKKIALIDC